MSVFLSVVSVLMGVRIIMLSRELAAIWRLKRIRRNAAHLFLLHADLIELLDRPGDRLRLRVEHRCGPMVLARWVPARELLVVVGGRGQGGAR